MTASRLLAALFLLCSTTAFADDKPAPAPAAAAAPVAPSADDGKMTPEQFMASLKPQHGEVKLPNGVATLKLPDSFYYLNPDDAERVLVDAWGNPPSDEKSLGMIVPSAVSPVSDEGWAVIVTYDKDGHVKDDDAAKLDYGNLLKEMQENSEEANEERKKQGYKPLHLVGWAEPPSYDAANHKMIWAKQLSTVSTTGDAKNDSLNYNIRVLGREGVLVLNAVASMSDLAKVKQEMPQVLAFTNFNDGNKYTDFKPGTDKVAAYGLAALVAGGVAAKIGLFAKLGAILLAAKKLVVIAVVAIGGFFAKLFKRKPKT